MQGPPWKSLEWFEQNSPPDARVMSAIAPSIELYTNRLALPGVAASNVEMFLYRLREKHLDYIVDRSSLFLTPGIEGTDNPNNFWALMRLRLKMYPERFVRLYENPEEETIIYRVNVEPEFVQAYDLLIKANASYQAGRFEEALSTVREALRKYPKFGSAANLLGALYWRSGDLVHAERSFQESIEYLPSSTHAMMNLATLYRQEGRYDRSEQVIARAKALGAERGELDDLDASIRTLYADWDNKRGVIFLDKP